MTSQPITKSNQPREHARMLWIDGVGGFLLVAGSEWLIGGPGAGDAVDINIHGDVSRRAAAIRRQGSDYVLQPLAEVHVQGQKLDRPRLLRDAEAFQLGGSVQLTFRKSHPLSASARLDLTSRHRSEPRCDAIILLADTCVIGPSKGAHIHCPKWTSDVIVFVSGNKWQLRSDDDLIVDGKDVGQRAIMNDLGSGCRIESETFTMSMERVPA